MQGKTAELVLRLKGNIVVRTIFFPLMRYKVYLAKKRYLNSDAPKKMKQFHGIHDGQRVFIIGNGPSLTVEDLEKIKDEYSIGVNRIYNIFSKTQWRPTYYLAVDDEFIQSEWDNIKKMDGIRLIKNLKMCSGNLKNIIPIHINSTTPIKRHNYQKNSISTDLAEGFSINFSVTCYAIELAIYMGFKEIYLIGVDHHLPKEITASGKVRKSNVKDHYNDMGYQNGQVSYYIDAVTNCYVTYENYSRKNGIKIYNATRGGKLEVFERCNFDRIVNDEN